MQTASLAGGSDVDPPVFGAAFCGAVVGDRMIVAIAFSLQAAGIRTELEQAGQDRLGGLLGEVEIGPDRPGR